MSGISTTQQNEQWINAQLPQNRLFLCALMF